MSAPIFLDTNVPIYAAGTDHPLKAPCANVLNLAARHAAHFVTSVEVVQELLHRYASRSIWKQGGTVVRGFMRLMEGRILPVEVGDIELATELMDAYAPRLSSRDLVHVAVMRRAGSARIVSADAAFDAVAGIERLDPARFNDWAGAVAT